MNPLLKITLLIALASSFGRLYAIEQPRLWKGTVFQHGKPAKGVYVTVDKSKSRYFTSFDGKYEVKAGKKSKWIKFQLADREVTLGIDPNGNGYLDCDLQENEIGVKKTESIDTNRTDEQKSLNSIK